MRQTKRPDGWQSFGSDGKARGEPNQAIHEPRIQQGRSQRTAAFAERIRKAGKQPVVQAAFAIEIALQRSPTNEEITKSAELISSDGLVKFCQALLNLNEFVYLP